MAREETARREAEGQPPVRPEDSESIEVKIIVDESAGERLVDVARWLMATGSNGRASTRNRQVRVSGVRVPTPCGTVLPGIG